MIHEYKCVECGHITETFTLPQTDWLECVVCQKKAEHVDVSQTADMAMQWEQA